MRQPRPAPAVLLVHMLSRSHAEWDLTAEALNVSGFGVLASTCAAMAPRKAAGSALGVHAAGRPGRRRTGSRPARTSYRTGSASPARRWARRWRVLAAAADPAVRSIALLSPAGRVPRPALRSRDAPVCRTRGRGHAGRLDRRSLCAALARINFEAMRTGPRDLRVVDGTNAHGTTLLSVRPDLVASLVDWFRRSLL